MNKYIWKGILDKYKASATLKAAIPRMYLIEAPQEKIEQRGAYPYCVVIPIVSDKEYTFTEAADNLQVQFSIYDDDDTVATINDAADKLKAVFDFASITVTGYNHICMQQEYSELMHEDKYWHQVIVYNLIIQKTR